MVRPQYLQRDGGKVDLPLASSWVSADRVEQIVERIVRVFAARVFPELSQHVPTEVFAAIVLKFMNPIR
ncbi:MAG: hypothetical protein WA823_03020 [Candidatus Acidiferrales bacterium]